MGQKGQSYYGQRGEFCLAKRVKVEWLFQLETEKAQTTRSQQILAKAKEYGIPENYAKRCAIKDDEDLDAYFKDLKQEFANDGFKGVVPPDTAKKELENETQSFAKMIADDTKEIVEQQKQ